MNEQTTTIASAAPTSDDTPTLEATLQQKRLALSLISVCHTLNHLQYSITSVMFPVMMTELGFGLLQLGALSAISNFVGQGLQVVYGLFTGFFKRSVILGTGNVIVGISAISQYFVGSYPQLLAPASPSTPDRARSIRSVRAFCRDSIPRRAAGR